MTRAYLDTSAAGKLLIDEDESAALAAWIEENDAELVSTLLVETELRRVAARHDLPQADVTTVLDYVSLYEMPPSLYREAGLLPGASLRSLDALHLAGAIRIGAQTVLTYDTRLAQSAQALGLHALAPS
ncbi:MAG: type II toxin-antitoxin system VapC family toxin [Microbacterium sp.]|uniref:type II toxin-antitoxin system VapC family toxin n=1 Tax=Microbacterium sp. TaxID=51671 RepID=UPI0039E5BD21